MTFSVVNTYVYPKLQQCPVKYKKNLTKASGRHPIHMYNSWSEETAGTGCVSRTQPAQGMNSKFWDKDCHTTQVIGPPAESVDRIFHNSDSKIRICQGRSNFRHVTYFCRNPKAQIYVGAKNNQFCWTYWSTQ